MTFVTHMSISHSLEVVGRGNETQFKVGAHFKKYLVADISVPVGHNWP